MAQLGHPFAAQVKASQKRRLASVGAKAGKGWGNQASQQTKSYPKTNAGTERPMTISGGTAPKRADHYARGGKVKPKGNTTNIIISTGGDKDQQPPAAMPVPVPVGAPPRPPMGPPPGPVGGPPMGGPPPMMGPPPGGPGMGPPPGLMRKDGGSVPTFKSGGFLKNAPGNSYRGAPHSPTTSVDDAVSAHKKGGAVKKASPFGGKMAAPFGKPAAAPAAAAPVMKAGSGSGESRMERSGLAAKVPADTEL